MTPGHLVSISEASSMLGVSEAALRQWTDEGRIKAFITPGGHRRYSREDLKKFMGANRKTLGIRDLASELEETVEMHRAIETDGASSKARLSSESHEQLALLGRRLLSLIIRYVTEPAKREETIRSAREVGSGFGNMLSQLGLPLTGSVEAFIAHRDPIVKAATNLMKKKEGFTGQVVEAIPLVEYVMDQALVSLVAAHQQCQGTPQIPVVGEKV